MLMVALRATVRAFWREDPLARAIGRVNNTFHQSVPYDKYATFWVGKLDLGSGRLHYVNAGHNRPLLVHARGGVDVLAEGGTILGAFETGQWQEGAVQMEAGDTLLVFSDGVSDTWLDEDLAARKLVDMLRTFAHLSAADLQAAIFRELDRQSTLKTQDDRTLLILKRLPN
jgi:sigma-B regulation protein RsbU (phosphoserine phosphatase)